MGNNIAGKMQETEQNAYYSGETWVAGKAEPISPTVAASLGEPMLRGNRRDQKRGAGEIRTYHQG